MVTQARRRSATRARLLDAAMARLVDSGYGKLTTTAVVKGSGLSQGALFSHFPSKNDLLAATVEHLFGALTAQFEARFAALAAAETPTAGAALDLLGDLMQDERYLAVLELYSAARTDADLQAALAPVVTAHDENLRRLSRELPLDLAPALRDTFDDLISLATLALQGAAVHQLARPTKDAVADVLAALTRLTGIDANPEP